MKSVKKQIASLACVLAAIAAFASYAAEIKHYELKVGDFSHLSVEDGINVEYYCSPDSAGMALFDAPKAIAGHIIFDSSKEGKLLIQKAFHGKDELSHNLPTVKVYSRFLSRVQNSGDSTVRVMTVAPTDEFKATVIGNGRLVIKGLECTKFDGAIKTGNGNLVVNGRCDRATLSNTGVGNIQADNLTARNASCRFFGTGTTGVNATEQLVIKGMFPGKLYYRGKPAKMKNYSMGVKIYSIDHPEEAEDADNLKESADHEDADNHTDAD